MSCYSNRHIWQITYPILISLLMENMIGLTDTAFLGRVGEVELGRIGPGRRLFHGHLHARLRIQYRRANPDRPA